MKYWIIFFKNRPHINENGHMTFGKTKKQCLYNFGLKSESKTITCRRMVILPCPPLHRSQRKPDTSGL